MGIKYTRGQQWKCKEGHWKEPGSHRIKLAHKQFAFAILVVAAEPHFREKRGQSEDEILLHVSRFILCNGNASGLVFTEIYGRKFRLGPYQDHAYFGQGPWESDQRILGVLLRGRL